MLVARSGAWLRDEEATVLCCVPGRVISEMGFTVTGGAPRRVRQRLRNLRYAVAMPMVGDFGRWRREPGLSRKFALLLGWSALIVVGAGTIAWALYIWTKSRQPIMIDDVFSIATLAVTFFAGVVALMAYQVSTGLPKLKLEINSSGQVGLYNFEWRYTAKRSAELQAWFNDKVTREAKLEGDLDWITKVAYIWIVNESKYSANAPAVIVRFGTGEDSPVGLCKEWPSTAREEDLPWKDIDLKKSARAVLAMEWDGGYPIHGHSRRRLPDLRLATLYGGEGQRKFDIELLADGYRDVQPITMNFIVEPETEQQQAIHQRGKGGLGDSGNGSGT